MAADPDLLLRSAITNKELIEFTYNGLPRIVEPHVYGQSKGNPAVLGVQVGGYTHHRNLPNWRRFNTPKMENLRYAGRRFTGPTGPTTAGHAPFDEVYARVTPAPPLPSETEERTHPFPLMDVLEAIHDRDADAIAQLLADDATLTDPALSEPVQGKPALRRFLARALKSIDDTDAEALALIQQGRHAALLLHVQGTYARDLELPTGATLPVIGQEFDLETAYFLTRDLDGKITRIHRVSNVWGLMRQLKIEPEEMEGLLQRAESHATERLGRGG